MSASPAPLPEISEHDAGDVVSRLYDDIRACLRAKSVPLLYRVLAAEPSCLVWAWQLLAPCAGGGVLDRIGLAARRAIRPAALAPPRAACRLAGLDDAQARAASAVVSAFNHANPLNLAALLILERAACCGLVPRAGPLKPGMLPAAAPPPLPRPNAIGGDARAAIDFLASCGFRRAVPAIPTLWSALSAYPPALALAAVVLASGFETGEIDREATAIAAGARDALGTLPMTTCALPSADAAAHLARLTPYFAEMIPTMIAIGARLLPLFDESRRP